MDELRSEEEQVEALRRWWKENGTSTIVAIVVALSAGFGWQAWQGHQQGQQEQASNLYQELLVAVAPEGGSKDRALEFAQQLKSGFPGTTYAQFAALHLAAVAVSDGEFDDAQAQLRWVLGKAASGSENAQIAQLRLARVLAAAGDTEQALTILAEADGGSYQASYEVARGDILYSLERKDEAREAYNKAMLLNGIGGAGTSQPALQQKLQSLSPALNVAADIAPLGTDSASTMVESAVETDSAEDAPEEEALSDEASAAASGSPEQGS